MLIEDVRTWYVSLVSRTQTLTPDQSIVATAIPVIVSEFQAFDMVSWVITGYFREYSHIPFSLFPSPPLTLCACGIGSRRTTLTQSHSMRFDPPRRSTPDYHQSQMDVALRYLLVRTRVIDLCRGEKHAGSDRWAGHPGYR
jgi:hypothetical protein